MHVSVQITPMLIDVMVVQQVKKTGWSGVVESAPLKSCCLANEEAITLEYI